MVESESVGLQVDLPVLHGLHRGNSLMLLSCTCHAFVMLMILVVHTASGGVKQLRQCTQVEAQRAVQRGQGKSLDPNQQFSLGILGTTDS